MTNSESNDATEVATKLEQFAAMHRREATFGQWLPAQPWMAISQLEARAAAVIRQQIAREAELAAEIAKLKAERDSLRTRLAWSPPLPETSESGGGGDAD